MVINHNMSLMNASRVLGQVAVNLADTSEKLASGYRINRAADDAAGLSISEKMRQQIRGLNRASKNAQDGISFVQTAEGALNELHDLLQRGRELSVQAANDANTPQDREAAAKEIRNLLKEIDRIARDTEFNTLKVFDSSNAVSSLAAGQNGGIGSNIVRLTAGGPKIIKYGIENIQDAINAAGAAGKSFTVAGLEQFGRDLKTTYLPKLLGHIVNALDTSAVPTVAGMKIGLKLYYENNSTLAYVGSNGVLFELGVNLKYLTENNGQIDMTADLATTIAHEMTHAVMFDINTNGMLGVYGGDRFPSWFVEGVAQSVGGAMNYLALMPDPNNTAALQNWMSGLTNTSDPYNAYAQGYIGSMYLGYTAGGGGAVTAGTIADGLDKLLKDVSDGYSLGQAISRHTKYKDLADFEKNFSSDAVGFVKDLKAAAGNGTGSIISPNGLSGTKNSLLTGSASNNYFELDLDHNRVTNNMGGKNPYTGGGATTTGGIDRNGNKNPNAQQKWGGQTGNTGGQGSVAKDLILQVGALGYQGIKLNCYKLSQKDLGIDSIRVDTFENAGKAIDSFDHALETVSSIRSYYGAMQNRLEHIIANLDNTAENISAAESRLRDADIAKMMVEYSRENILMQVGQSMLAQESHSRDGVLLLLQ